LIGSVFEQRDELLAIENRRQRIAEQAAQPPVAALTGPMSGAAMAAAGPAAAVKAAEPAVAKRKKKGRDRTGRDMAPGETALDAVGEGMRAANEARADDAEAVKAFRDRGVTEGPGRPVMPSQRQPADSFSRPYLDAGHAAPSPQQEPPRTSPMPNLAPGVVTAVTLPAAPSAMNVPLHVSNQYCGGSPSER
jgi:hypothetical protein